MSHTPGPWKLDGPDINGIGNVVGFYVAVPSGGRVGQSFANCLVTTNEQCEANARLIAAAPELLETLKAMVKLFNGFQGMALTNAKAAIAKAEGK